MDFTIISTKQSIIDPILEKFLNGQGTFLKLICKDDIIFIPKLSIKSIKVGPGESHSYLDQKDLIITAGFHYYTIPSNLNHCLKHCFDENGNLFLMSDEIHDTTIKMYTHY